MRIETAHRVEMPDASCHAILKDVTPPTREHANALHSANILYDLAHNYSVQRRINEKRKYSESQEHLDRAKGNLRQFVSVISANRESTDLTLLYSAALAFRLGEHFVNANRMRKTMPQKVSQEQVDEAKIRFTDFIGVVREFPEISGKFDVYFEQIQTQKRLELEERKRRAAEEMRRRTAEAQERAGKTVFDDMFGYYTPEEKKQAA